MKAGGRHNMPRRLWPWPLSFWPWKWCPSHVWRGLSRYLCANFSLPRHLCSRLKSDIRDRQTDKQTSDRQTSDSIIA